MSHSIIMRTTQRFTSEGKLGVWLLMLSPLASGASYAWLLNELASERYSANPVPPALALSICGLAFIGGAVLALIGRDQVTVEVRHGAPADVQPERRETYTDEANRKAVAHRA